MRFLDICAERFGVLQQSELRDLSPGMTVVYGGNGSGKSTMVSFLKGLLFGFTGEHFAFQADSQRFGGSASLATNDRSYRITRERSHGVSSELSTVDLATGISVMGPENSLPNWVDDSVYDEIFSVGQQEVDRFDLLTRLCLVDAGSAASEDEIRKVELAIDQSVRERDGNGMEGGLRQQMNALHHRRQDLVEQLAEMRKSDPTIPARISEMQAELHRLQDALAQCERQIREVESHILELEARLVELRRHNVVSLNRREIESQITQLQERQRRWDEIRKSINREIGALQQPATGLKNRDSLKSIRALVSRLEQRMESLQSDQSLPHVVGTGRDVFVDHLRSEVFSLCDYVAHHESAVESHEVALESLFGQRTLQDAENLNTVLQGQIEALREELNRSEDIISVRRGHEYSCESPGHLSYQRTATGRAVNGSIEELEAEVARLRRQLDHLGAERSQYTAQIQHAQHELSLLESQRRNVASLEDIDRVNAEIAEIDAKLELLQNRWSVLEDTERNLRETLERLNEYHGPEVLSLASEYIQRLTDGDCYDLQSDAAGVQILASTRQSTVPQAIKHLSRGTRDQVALSLRLALIQTRADSEARCPLILDDVFITADDERAAAVADLLMEVAADGQQIIFFTCQKDVRDLFARRHASIRDLEEREVVARPLPQLPVTQTVFQPQVKPAPQPIVQAPTRVVENTNWLFYLEVDNSIEDLSGLTVAEIEAVRNSGLVSVDDLLTASVDELEARFRTHGYGISRDRIRAWRGQGELSTLVPMLRRSDAELLYAAGIESTIELSRMRPETVYDIVVKFQDSHGAARFRRSGRAIDRQQAINWSRWSQHSRSLTEARQSRSRFFVKASDVSNSPHSSPVSSRRSVSADSVSSSSEESGISRRRARRTRSGTATRRQRVPNLSSNAQLERERRMKSRRERLSRHSSSYRTSPTIAENTTVAEERELRFYLNRSDDVEAAPSIGPKTAQRLGTVGVYTVDDLLNADPVDTAERLKNRKINADTIIAWQSQARLVCTVPELRGHDSQILVACGVTDSEQLAGKRPADLYAVVGPFSDTSEGERIIRSGKKPDLEEVTDWIRFAQQARPLRAAA